MDSAQKQVLPSEGANAPAQGCTGKLSWEGPQDWCGRAPLSLRLSLPLPTTPPSLLWPHYDEVCSAHSPPPYLAPTFELDLILTCIIGLWALWGSSSDITVPTVDRTLKSRKVSTVLNVMGFTGTWWLGT